MNDLETIFDPTKPDSYRIVLGIRAMDADSFEISINHFNVNFFLRKNIPVLILPSSVMFSTLSGNCEFSRYSNSITVGTYKTASIKANAYLNNYNSHPGELNTYSITLENIGSEIAKNVLVQLPIPGIVNNTNNFTILEDNILSYNLTELAPSEVKIIHFTFFTPNSRAISGASVTYEDNQLFENESYGIAFPSSISNNVYMSAPIDYVNRTPFVRIIDISYQTSNSTPEIDDEFNLTVNVKNSGPQNGIKIPDIILELNYSNGGLKRIDNKTISLTNIGFQLQKSFNITLKKTDWKGYYFPPIISFQSSESNTIQIERSIPIVIGVISLDIRKIVDKNNVDYGDIINVNVEVENMGNIGIKNITISDIGTFSGENFSLIEGTLTHHINSLDPNETYAFSYKIQANIQSNTKLKASSIAYYYLILQIAESNEIQIISLYQEPSDSKTTKTQQPNEYLILVFSIIGVVSASILFGIYKKKFKSDEKLLRTNKKEV